MDWIAATCRVLLCRRQPARRPVLTGAFCVTITLATASYLAAAPSIGRDFTGSRSTQTTLNPPDVMGAVGPAHIAELINGRFAVYDKASGALLHSSSLDTFWSNAGATPVGFAFDPRVLYDHSTERWFAVAVDNRMNANGLLVGVSSSPDPTMPWTGFRVQSDPGDQQEWADFPTLGLDDDGVYISANMPAVGSSSANSVSLLVLPKADLIAPQPSIQGAILLENLVDVGTSLQPVVDLDNSGLPLPVIGTSALRPSSFFYRAELRKEMGDMTLEVVGFPSIERRFGPPAAAQPSIGGPAKAAINTLDDRFGANAILRQGNIWAVQAIENEDRAAVRWFKMRESDGVILQSGILSDTELAFYYPSIAVNELGDVVIGFSGSSATQPVSSYAVVGQTTDGVTSFGEPMLLKAGVDDYERLDSRGRNRWGDYSATVVDPSDPMCFWTFQQFVSGDDEWAIQITQILVGDSTPQPGDANGDGIVDRADVAALAANFGVGQNATFADGDFNNDQIVNLLDAHLLQVNLDTGNAAAIPEPPTTLVALGMMLWLVTRGPSSRAARAGSLFGRASGWRPDRPRRFAGRR